MTAESYDWDAALEQAVADARAIRLEVAERDAVAAERAEERPAPDLSVGNVALAVNERIRHCSYCDKPILPQAGVVVHTPLPRVSAVRDHYHPACVQIEGTDK